MSYPDVSGDTPASVPEPEPPAVAPAGAGDAADAPPAAPPPPAAARYRLPLATLPALVLVVAGVALVATNAGGEVTSITLTRSGGFNDLVPGVGAPDYFLQIQTRERVIATEPFVDVPIGNGLTWQLPEPIPLEDIQEIEVYDEDLLVDDRMDRVKVTGWVAEGQRFGFELIGQRSPLRLSGILGALVGGCVLLVVAGKFIRHQVV